MTNIYPEQFKLSNIFLQTLQDIPGLWGTQVAGIQLTFLIFGVSRYNLPKVTGAHIVLNELLETNEDSFFLLCLW